MIDGAEKRRAAAGVGIPGVVFGLTPNAALDQEWRWQAGNSYFFGGVTPPEPEPPAAVQPTGGWNIFDAPQRRAEALRQQREWEREQLDLSEREQRRLDRAATKIARRIAKEGLNADRPAVMAAPAFDAILAALRPTEGQALALADAILQRVLWMAAAQQADEEAALMALLAEI